MTRYNQSTEVKSRRYYDNQSINQFIGKQLNITGNENINSDQLFQKATTTELRGHSLKLYKKVLDLN